MTDSVPECDPRQLDEGEVRAGPWACDDELMSGASGRRGDWVLQNHLVTAVVRNPAESFSLVDVSGGGLVDFAAWDGVDRLWEAQPVIDGEWLEVTETEYGDDDGAWIRLTGPQGEVTWRLPADERFIELSGADLWLHGDRRSERLASGVLRNTSMIVTDGQRVQDLGGAQLFTDVTRIWTGSLEAVHTAIGGVAASGSCDGDGVDVWVGAERTGRLPSEFDALVPADALLVCTGEGFADGSPSAPGSALELGVGDAGELELRVVGEGHELPVVVTIDGQAVGVSPRRDVVPTGAGRFDVQVDAGPEWAGWSGQVDVVGDTVLELSLERRFATPDHVLADLFQAPFPSYDSALEQNDALRLAAGQGVGVVVQAPIDEVGRPYQGDWTERHTRAVVGSRTASGHGSVWSWPWESSDKKSGHGAVKWTDLDAHGVLAQAKGYADPDRVAVVDTTWIAAAGLPATWPEDPDALRLADLSDLDSLFELLDAEVRVAVAGPWTWIEADDTLGPPSMAALDRAVVQGRTVATTGPLVTLRRVALPQDHWQIVASSGSTELWVDGVMVAEDERVVPFVGQRWAVAVVRGEDWAVTSPVWIGDAPGP